MVFLIWLLVSMLSLGVGLAATASVAELTHSGLGSCGPYGPAFNLVVCMLIGSFPVSVVAGCIAAWRFRRYLAREN